jgi:1-deoxy-D-xylulose 5-phosphate reductoisomerase
VRFPEIWEIVEQVMNQHTPVAHADLDAILGADQWARAQAQGCVAIGKRLKDLQRQTEWRVQRFTDHRLTT